MTPLLHDPAFLRDGSDVRLNGTTYRLKIIGADDTRLLISKRPDELLSEDSLRYEAALRVLHGLAQVVTEINERLLDPLDGMTNRCVRALLESPDVSVVCKDALRPWALALFRHGSNVHSERGCVFLPPVAREQLSREIRAMPAQRRGPFRWRDFLKHVFDPVPWSTQGFYLFDRPDDRLRFEQLLGAGYATVQRKLFRLFEEAQWEPESVPSHQWKRLDLLSRQAMEMQRERLEPELARADAGVRSMTTRVRIRCYDDGNIRFLVRPYSYEFGHELSQCALLLDRARAELPPRAVELRNVLGDLSDWCRTRTDDPAWGESLPSWIAADGVDSLLDVSLTAEEKISRLGAKSGLQLAVSTFERVPETIQHIVDMLHGHENRPNLNVVWLKHLVVGGSAGNALIAGEKLPDPDGRPQYKVMTFTNAVRASMVESNAELIVAATDFRNGDIPRLANTANLLVLLHELGHTLGDHATFLGELGTSVEETNAEASVVYLARMLAPTSLKDIIGLAVCWTPVHRTLRGPAEPHSHSSIVLFDEILRAGGVAIRERDGRAIVAPASIDAAVHAAFALALRMRLWEIGIPSAHHHQWLVPFDVAGEHVRVVTDARAWLQSLDSGTLDAWREEVLGECREFFAPERLQTLAQSLQEVIDRLPRFQPLALIPTDDRYRLVLSLP